MSSGLRGRVAPGSYMRYRPASHHTDGLYGLGHSGSASHAS